MEANCGSHGHSVNDGIQSDSCSMKYTSIDEAVNVILRLGQRTQLFKIDLKDAYRIVPMHLDDHVLLGVAWQGELTLIGPLPFGLRSAPKLFSAVADAVAWSLHMEGFQWQIHYLDDFCFSSLHSSTTPGAKLSVVLNHMARLSVPVATHKTEGPSTCISFLGILIDTDKMELRLPMGKVQRFRQVIQEWCGKTSCTSKDLESFLGHLSHAASVIRPGHTFLRQLFCLLSVTRRPAPIT